MNGPGNNNHLGDVIALWPVENVPYTILEERAAEGDEEAAEEMRRREQRAKEQPSPRP